MKTECLQNSQNEEQLYPPIFSQHLQFGNTESMPNLSCDMKITEEVKKLNKKKAGITKTLII
jgi:hypothetical protein